MLGDWCNVPLIRFPDVKKKLIINEVMKNVHTVQPDYLCVQKVKIDYRPSSILHKRFKVPL